MNKGMACRLLQSKQFILDGNERESTKLVSKFFVGADTFHSLKTLTIKAEPMTITATMRNSLNKNQVQVRTDENEKEISIPPKV
jgi:hypothetical protein